MFAVIYIRVSTQDQVQGYSLNFQKDVCEEYAKRNGVTIAKTFVEEGVSGRSIEKRTAFRKMINYVKGNNNIQAMIVWKYDRFSRSVKDSANVTDQLEKLGAKLLSATEDFDTNSSVGKFQRNMQFAMSEFESDKIRERTKAGMKKALQEGYWVHTAPYGYKFSKPDNNVKHKKLVIVPHQARAIKLIFRMVREKNSASQVIEALKEHGYDKICLSNIYKLVTNPIYCGLMRTSLFEDVLPGNHEPIISKDEFYETNRIRNNKPQTSHKSQEYPFNSFLKCQNSCWLSGYTKKQKYIYYKCRDNCVNISQKRIEEAIKTFLNIRYTIKPDIWPEIEDNLNIVLRDHQKDRIEQRMYLRGKIKTLKKREERLDNLLIDSVISKEKYKQKITELKEDKEKFQNQLNLVSEMIFDIEAVVYFTKEICSNPYKIWKESTIHSKIALQELFFPKGLIVNKDKSVRIPEKPVIVNILEDPNALLSKVASRRGVEPLLQE